MVQDAPSGTPRGVIWDLDGVIVDSRQAHFLAWRRLGLEIGLDVTYDRFLPTFGRKNADILRDLLGRDLTENEIDEMSARKESFFREEAATATVAFPGVLTLLRDLASSGVRQAIGSSAPRENIDLILSLLGVREAFAAIVAAEDISRGKPDPQVFVTAASRLEVPPSRCAVIEDAVAGVAAGKAAGMKVIAVTNTRAANELAEADLVVASLEQVSASVILRTIDPVCEIGGCGRRPVESPR